MKAIVALSLLVLAAPVAAESVANPECAAKAEALEQQIQAAKAAGHRHKASGLETALQHVRADCTDAGLAQARADNLREARDEVAERQRDLHEAQRDGDADKIARREAKLREARAELEQAEAALRN